MSKGVGLGLWQLEHCRYSPATIPVSYVKAVSIAKNIIN